MSEEQAETEEQVEVEEQTVPPGSNDEVSEALRNVGLNPNAGLPVLIEHYETAARNEGVEEALARDSSLVRELHTFLDEEEGAVLTQDEVRAMLTRRNDIREA